MNVLAVIPARYGSTRFPGKPLVRKTGRPLIQHVVERASAARAIDRVVVATDDARIVNAVRSFGGEAVMTRGDHASGTDRIAEVAQALGGAPDDLVLNVQGDEPEIEPAYLDRLVDRVRGSACPVGTLACPFPADNDPRDPNCVKVVLNLRGEALYFSRALIPYPRADAVGESPAEWLLHLGVYAFRRSFLLEFASWETSRLERLERLEQLRVLERGHGIAVEVVERAFPGVDTPEDYERFVARISAIRTGTPAA